MDSKTFLNQCALEEKKRKEQHAATVQKALEFAAKKNAFHQETPKTKAPSNATSTITEVLFEEKTLSTQKICAN